MDKELLIDFVNESNGIERIFRDAMEEEIEELSRFLRLRIVTIEELERFVSIYQPEAHLRDEVGMDVRVGNYFPPSGGPHIRPMLQKILDEDQSSYLMHIAYEKLHPFMDGNGRSGRALWAWRNKGRIAGGFLLNFYFQALKNTEGLDFYED